MKEAADEGHSMSSENRAFAKRASEGAPDEASAVIQGRAQESRAPVRVEDGAGHLDAARELIGEYVAWLGRDLSFQGLEEELAHLGSKYLPPHGELLVAVEEGENGSPKVLGMVAFTGLGKGRCELKRLYVRPEARGRDVAATLMDGIIERAKKAGFGEMVLDTLESMVAARTLYAKFGFEQCEAYYHNPMPDVVYMRRAL